MPRFAPMTAPLALLLAAGAAAAFTADDLPNFSYEDAVSCLAYKTAEMESPGYVSNAGDATELDFWAKLIEVKATPEQSATHEGTLAEALADARSIRAGEGMTADEADYDLTMMAKYCWFNALTVPGVGPFAEE